jgi:tetratricopeptide (TPR) repeat protein
MNASSTTRRWLWGGAFAVTLLTLAAHGCGLFGHFVEWDDTTHVTQNPVIRALTLTHIWSMFTAPIAKLYIPLTWLSFAVDYQFWGHDPFGYHLTNLVLHLANTLLVLALVYAILRERSPLAAPVAVLTAAIFGVHPLRVESVAWATERKDVLFAFFFLLAAGAYLRWVRQGKRAAYGACLTLFIASALSKSTAVTFPLVLLLLDGSLFRRRALAEKIPFFAVSLVIGWVTILAQAGGEGQTLVNTEAIPVWGRLGLVGYCSLFYVKQFFWPFHLSAVYPGFDELGWTPLTAAGWLCGFAVVTGAVLALRRRAPVLWPSWVYYLLTLLPTIGLVPVGIHVVADRFSYLPLLGLALPLSFGLVTAVRRLRQHQALAGGLAAASVAALVVCLAVLSAQRTAIWENTESLFQDAIRNDPNCLPAYVNLTLWYTRHKQFDKAIACGQRAVEIAPDGLPGRRNLAHALFRAGRPRDAIEVLRVPAEHHVEDLDLWRTLGECFIAGQDWKNAQAACENALRLAQTSADRQDISALLNSVHAHLDQDGTAPSKTQDPPSPSGQPTP